MPPKGHGDAPRAVIRDKKSYCGILLDDNNRKPICRLYFNGAQRFIGVFSTDADRKEERLPIPDLSEIYRCADRLKATVAGYDNAKEGPKNKKPEASEAPLP